MRGLRRFWDLHGSRGFGGHAFQHSLECSDRHLDKFSDPDGRNVAASRGLISRISADTELSSGFRDRHNDRNDAGKFTAMVSTRNPDASADWLNNPFAYSQAVIAAIYVLRELKPAGKAELPSYKHLPPKEAERLKQFATGTGLGSGRSTIAEIVEGKSFDSNPEQVERVQRLHEELGPFIDRLGNALLQELKGEDK